MSEFEECTCDKAQIQKTQHYILLLGEGCTFKLKEEQIQILKEFFASSTEDPAFREWHDTQKESSESFKKILVERNLAQGGRLSLDELYEAGRLISAGLGSTVLGIRGKYSPFEANSIDIFNSKLRNLLYSSDELGRRVDDFLDMKYVGIQTVSQFLCKYNCEKYPFFAEYMRDVFESLSIDETQLLDARRQAEEEFKLGTDIRNNPTWEYFKYFVILREIKNELGLEDYLETQNLLWNMKKLDELASYETSDSEQIELEAGEPSYFILRTGGGEYSEIPESRYNFKEGIPGYKQLLQAEGKARFVYIENGLFYGKGRIGNIRSYEKEGVKFYDADVLDYESMEPLRYSDVSQKLSKFLSQAGIMKISEEDYKLLTRSPDLSVFKYTIDDFVRETGFEKAKIEGWLQILQRKKQIIFQGPPGTGKTFVAQRLAKILVSETTGLIEVVQFHPDYSYEDFIQGYFPEPENGVLQFKLKKGRFLEFCDKAQNRGNGAPCVIVIDEINRAKLARVFGELMYLLEYRDKEIPLAAGGQSFKIPENVYMIGTMNTADRSIALVDHALRRRFSFIRLQPEYEILANSLKKSNLPAEGLIAVLEQINQAIEDPNYQIGISFFMKDQERLKSLLPIIWKTEVEPYLEEYFYDQASKVESFRWDNLVKDRLKDWIVQS